MNQQDLNKKIEALAAARLKAVGEDTAARNLLEEEGLDFLAHSAIDNDPKLFPSSKNKEFEKQIAAIKAHALKTEKSVIQILIKFKSKNPKVMELLKQAQGFLKSHTKFIDQK